jgi:hypothetical protein
MIKMTGCVTQQGTKGKLLHGFADEGQTQGWTLFWMIDYQRLAGSVSAALLE